MITRSTLLSCFLLALTVPSLPACDADETETPIPQALVVRTTADDVAVAVAEHGQLTIELKELVVYRFELGPDPSVWDDVSVVVDGEHIPFDEVVAARGDHLWEAGSFEVALHPDAFEALTDEEIEDLLRNGVVLREGGGDDEPCCWEYTYTPRFIYCEEVVVT